MPPMRGEFYQVSRLKHLTPQIGPDRPVVEDLAVQDRRDILKGRLVLNG